MLKAVLLAELTGASDAAVHRTLGSNPETAAAIGFAPDDVPDQSTLSRARRNRFTALEQTVTVAIRQIRAIAARQGCSFGADPPEATASEEPVGSSKRTVNRLIRGKTREMLDKLTMIVFPALNLIANLM